jgi:DNA-binding MarR family transcriptional regulator
VLFVAAVAASPRHGLVSKLLAQRRLGRRLAEKLVLVHLAEAQAGRPLGRGDVERRFGWSPARLARVLARLRAAGWVEPGEEGLLRITPAGSAAVTAEDAAHTAVDG